MKRIAKGLTALALVGIAAGCSQEDGATGSQRVADVSGGGQMSVMATREIYLRSCHSCHGSGVSGAPRTGDTAAWAPRLAKGMDTLVANAINGYQAMPPRGLCFDCSEAQFADLIRYMANSPVD
ncbi:c-type cytochrome [Microbulbifer thermotolerans]|uniref:C-type cytochrome n=1 Tax=Microbulbifer thermotolerans TaxID=252514 RepID=A0AB35I0Z2_MICTH|nr:c-type cytochrome [Microbulbifer thermotolerans]MCX2781171.1 c-type cytochrome [Microbulbifer thermotolerans]MCX2784460.1 c-type cytochrome [Microbulbifer thermotolerans]MCX2796327.1 c-type cytochrome [Microbulbifer thermotolerans]MCX2803144.1 c-type cytochrome [Microbulbifer thermotolerans]MCX2806566.1 c-type cytochrome [Microbulbifer thermotolerans]